MFRKMRRFGQQLSEAVCEEILKNRTTGILACAGDGGYPYAVPINYAYIDGKIYYHGANVGHKTDALRREDRVSLCVIDRDDVVPERLSTDYRSVIIFGRARIIEDDEELRRSARLLGLRYTTDEAFIEWEINETWSRLSCVEITIEHMTGKESAQLAKARREEAEGAGGD